MDSGGQLAQQTAIMSRPPKFAFKSTTKGWLVHVPASLSDTGKLSRRYFATRDKAKDFASKLHGSYKSDGEKASTLPPRVADDASAATRLLHGTGLTLRDAAREVTAALEILGDSGTIREAVLAHRARHDARLASKPLGEAVEIYLARPTNLEPVTINSYKSTVSKLFEPLHGRMMSDIQVSDMDPLLKDLGATSRAMHIRNFSVFWRWAAKMPREWADVKILEALEYPNSSEEKEIGILNPIEVKALLEAAELDSPAAAASYALAVFAGIRMNEITKLIWADVDEEGVELGPRVTKTKRLRNVPLCPTLTAWLDATRGNSKGTDKIVPPNWEDVKKSVRRRAGWDVVDRRLPDEVLHVAPTLGKWKANAPRHTCASVQVAIGTPLSELIFKFGHTEGVDILRKHYVRRLKKKDALAILAIGPNGSTIAGLD